MIVIVPSNRNLNIGYLEPLIEHGARFIIVDDSEGSIKIDHPAFEVYTWKDRRRMLGALDDGFPKRNGACRDFGFYLAWQQGETDEIIIALDDDCEIDSPNFGLQVEAALSPTNRPLWQGSGRHANILELYKNVPQDLYPRGFPYSSRFEHIPWEASGTTSERPLFNLGLWSDAFDVNAVDKIVGPKWRHPDVKLHHHSMAIPPGVLISVCSMNMQFRKSVLPAVFQLPMHVEVMPNWVIDRYGDIWGGFILKLLMDRRGDLMTVGEPMIAHRKAGDLKKNIWQEHIAHMINDEFIELIFAAAEEVVPGDYIEMMANLRDGLERRKQTRTPILAAYLEHLLISMECWLTALA